VHGRGEARRNNHSNFQQFRRIRDDLEPTTRARGFIERITSQGKLPPLNVRFPELISFSFPVRDPSLGEEEILLGIIRLDIKKIRQYINDFRSAKGVFEEPISTVESRILTASSHIAPFGLHQFLE
jgi:hypothetical protein